MTMKENNMEFGYSKLANYKEILVVDIYDAVEFSFDHIQSYSISYEIFLFVFIQKYSLHKLYKYDACFNRLRINTITSKLLVIRNDNYNHPIL
jgi:hypothetical protein